MIEPWWMWLPIVGFALMAAWVLKGNAAADAPPVTDRAPPEHEVKTALADLRAAVERLQTVLERQHDHHEDELRNIQRQLDRIEAGRRVEDALAAIYRQQRDT